MRVNWLYYLGDNKNQAELFVYGLSLPTNSKHQYNKSYKYKQFKIGDKYITLYESVSEFNDDIISENRIKMNNIHSNLTQTLEIIANNSYIQNYENEPKRPTSPIGTTVYLNVFYTPYFYSYQNGYFLKEQNKNILQELIKALDRITNQQFSNFYYQRLGCFEYGKVMPWAEYKPAYELKVDRNENKYIIHKDQNYNINGDIVHLTIFTDFDNVILDEIKKFPMDSNIIKFGENLKNDIGYKFSVFDNDGKLIYKHSAYWANGLSLCLSLVQKDIKFNFIENKNTTSEQVQVFTPLNPIKISAHDNNIVKEICHNTNIIKILSKPNQNYVVQKWFDKQENSLREIMNFINDYLQGLGNEIIFIDPFFSYGAIKSLIFINNSSVQIKVISCWQNFDPDTGEFQADSIDFIKQTINMIQKLDGTNLPISNLSWYNLKSEKFHDRFIYIKKDDNNYKIFTISNSLNNMLKKYNFLICELDEETKINAKKYLDNLISTCNLKNRIFPEKEDA